MYQSTPSAAVSGSSEMGECILSGLVRLGLACKREVATYALMMLIVASKLKRNREVLYIMRDNTVEQKGSV